MPFKMVQRKRESINVLIQHIKCVGVLMLHLLSCH